MADIAIYWFRQDLRLSDNPALCQATQHSHVLPIYILDDYNAAEHKMGGASRWWLHHSLCALNRALDGRLHVYQGDAQTILKQITAQGKITAVYWNRCYEPWRIARDEKIKKFLKNRNICTESYQASLLWEPWTIYKSDGTHYKVFTPFYRKGCLGAPPPRAPLPCPEQINALHITEAAKLHIPTPCAIDDLALLPLRSGMRWDETLIPHWSIGEQEAQQRWTQFLQQGLPHYKQGRDFPAKAWVSRLSPHLHFGEISPHQLWYDTQVIADEAQGDHFRNELGWREFSYSQLYHQPDLPTRNLQSKFDRFPWCHDSAELAAWQRGQTGIPMVDAGMRELWQTGYMHNRVRMIVGSFLVKNLLLHWKHGERWFWDTLVDADLANNSASWQWIAGCGADAAPYFRIFNPVTQGQKFDPEGEYIRRYVPELAQLPQKYLYQPWIAPASVLAQAGIKLGGNYPVPLVDLSTSRKRALAAFASLKKHD